MGSNNHNDMGGHLVPYGKRKAGSRSKLKCVHYSKADNYCRKEKCKCFGATCIFYSESHLEDIRPNPKKEEVKKRRIVRELNLTIGSKITHRNFGEGVIIETNEEHINYIVIRFTQDNNERKIPVPQAFLDGSIKY